MLRITFKGVGQGDSILIEWVDEKNQMHIGIIDCNLINGKNPVLEHVQKVNYQQIDFLILSHPHLDHFSGFQSLIDYCESNGVQIGTFFHSCHSVPDYLKAACKSITASRALGLLFKKIQFLFNSDKLRKDILNQSHFPIIELSDQVKIKCLSPSERERDDYISTKHYYYNEEDDGNNPKANLLSSVLKISQENEDWYILLTADAEASTFKRLDIRHKEEFTGNLLLAQCPHHGAKSNCKRPFWQEKQKSINCFSVFSVGENKYGHPSQWARNVYINNGYSLRYTTPLSLLKQSNTSKSVSLSLTPFSKPVITSRDVIFEISHGEIREIL